MRRGCARLPACAPGPASSSQAGSSPSRSTICTDAQLCPWQEPACRSRRFHQLGSRAGILYSKPAAGISLSARGVFRLTMKSATLAILGILSHGNLDDRGSGFDHDSRNRRNLILHQRPKLVGVFLGPVGQNNSLSASGQSCSGRECSTGRLVNLQPASAPAETKVPGGKTVAAAWVLMRPVRPACRGTSCSNTQLLFDLGLMAGGGEIPARGHRTRPRSPNPWRSRLGIGFGQLQRIHQSRSARGLIGRIEHQLGAILGDGGLEVLLGDNVVQSDGRVKDRDRFLRSASSSRRRR
jgi:hypothetical protein